MNQQFNPGQRSAARISGFAIIIMTIAAIIATNVTIGSLSVENNAAETFRNLLESQMLFRAGIFSWLIILICDVFAAWGLYLFFKSVNKNVSLISAWFRIIYAAILSIAIIHLLDILPYLNASDYLYDSGSKFMETQVLFSVESFYNTWAFGLILFGIHILFLGYLALKSGYVPKIFGILLLLAFLGYVITNSSNLLFPQYQNVMNIVEYIFMIPMLGEVAFGIWLVYIGLKKIT